MTLDFFTIYIFIGLSWKQKRQNEGVNLWVQGITDKNNRVDSGFEPGRHARLRLGVYT